MASVPVAVVDALNSLLEAQQNSVFRFMGEGSPYLSRATADVRRPLQEMVESHARHAGEIAEMIQRLGGQLPRRSVQSEDQYLAFLSLKFLLPKLMADKELLLRRYENTLRALPPGTPEEVVRLLRAQIAECRAHLEALKRTSADVIAASRGRDRLAPPRGT